MLHPTCVSSAADGTDSLLEWSKASWRRSDAVTIPEGRQLCGSCADTRGDRTRSSKTAVLARTIRRVTWMAQDDATLLEQLPHSLAGSVEELRRNL